MNKRVREAGGRSYKWTSPGRAGVPDRILVFPKGRVYFVEVKTDKGRLSEIQKVQIGRLEDLEAQVRVVYGIEGVDRFIEEVVG